MNRPTKKQLASLIKKSSTLRQLAEDLEISESTLYAWRKDAGLI